MDNCRLLILTNHLPKEQTIEISSVVSSIEKMASINHIELLHVKPFVAAHCFALPSMVEFLDQCSRSADESLTFWGELLDVSTAHQWISSGNVRQEVQLFTRRNHNHYILASDQLKQHFTQRFHFSGRQQNTLIRSFGNLNFYSTDEAVNEKHWQHPIAHAI